MYISKNEKIGITVYFIVVLAIIFYVLNPTTTTSPRQIPRLWENERPPLSQLYFEQAPSVVVVERDDGGLGTGFFIGPYTIATANHVISGEEHVSIFVKGNPTAYVGTVLVASPETDLAIVRVATPFRNKPLTLTKRKQQIGDNIYVIGHPYRYKWSLSSGIVSHINRKTMERVLNNVIQIDAPINGGNSGGPVFNDRGEVIGVVSYGAVDSDGLGFIIPIRYLENLR